MHNSEHAPIVCFGWNGSFDFHQIGGTDSFFRRLAVELVARGHSVFFVHYGCVNDSQEKPYPGVTVFKYDCFDAALECLSRLKGHIMVNGVHRKDRLRFMGFRKNYRNEIKFYLVAAGFSESWLRRNLYLLDATLYPYNGGVLCMSPRLMKLFRRRRNIAELLLPPVSPQYYIQPYDKPDTSELVITYMGRTVPSKGAGQATEIFRALNGEPHIATQVCGYIWPNNREDHSIHNWLLSQNSIKYTYEEHKGWSPVIEEKVAEILRRTDILLLPYIKLGDTIDAPLMLLEGMAANCAIITKPLGDIAMIYGNSPFVLPQEGFVQSAVDMILRINQDREILKTERKRVAKQVARLDFGAASITDKLLSLIN